MAIVIYNSLHIMCLYLLLAVAWFCNANNNNNNNNAPKNGNELKGMFIFGSSVVDNGNNNDIMLSLAKANYPPYGIDFVDGPTGRFSNGKNVADFICDYLQLPLIPAYNTQTHQILRGLNFASAGSGILDETGLLAGKVMTLNEQIRNFENVTLPDLESQLKCQRTQILPHYLFLLAAGNNDYLLNYFLLGQPTQSPDAFAATLISTYSAQIKRLYKLGARKFVVISVYPLGCSPVVSRGQGCLARQNDIVSKFYDHLIPIINQIKTQLPGSDFVVLNSVKVISDIINNPITSGISNVSGSCCEVSLNGLSCRENGRVCNNRNEYAYFDGQHNTEALSAIVASKIYSSQDISEVYPLNLRQFLQAHSLN